MYVNPRAGPFGQRDDGIMLLFCPTGQMDFGKSKRLVRARPGYRASGFFRSAWDDLSARETHQASHPDRTGENNVRRPRPL